MPSLKTFDIFVVDNFTKVWQRQWASQGPLESEQINRPDYCNIYLAMIWQKLQTIFNKKLAKIERLLPVIKDRESLH